MKNSSAIISFLGRRLTLGLAVSLISIFLGACYTITAVPGTPGNPGAQVTSGWKARRYLYSTAWASTSSPTQMDVLSDSEQAVVNNGYVTTDQSGQARMRMGGDCTVYVFQNSASAYSGETITTCEKGSPSTCSNDFNGMYVDNKSACTLKLATIPASVTFAGTVAILLQYSDLDSIVILMSEGKAIVTPTGKNFSAFEIPPGQAAYMTTDESADPAYNFFGFKPGDLVDFKTMADPIQRMGRVPQIQRANLLLFGRNLPLVPVPDPFQLSLRWYNLPDERIANASEAIARYVHWGELMDANQFQGIPLFFQAGDPLIDLRAHDFSRAESAGLLETAGFSAGQGIVIGFDISIPNLGALATAIQQALQEGNLLTVSLEPYDPRSNEDPFLSIEKIKAPVIILGGY